MYSATTQCRCLNGLIVFMKKDDGDVFLECDECMRTYTDVVDGALVSGGLSIDIPGDTSYATEAEIRSRGWHSLIQSSTDS